MPTADKTINDFLSDDAEQAQLVASRRAAWPTSRDRILGILQRAAASGGERGTYAEAFTMFEHFSSVQFWFGTIPTGIVRREDGLVQQGVEGAAVVFGQGETGRVHVTFYPFETELPGQAGALRSGVASVAVEPEAVTDEWVNEQLSAFIEFARHTTFRAKAPAHERKIGFRTTEEASSTHVGRTDGR